MHLEMCQKVVSFEFEPEVILKLLFLEFDWVAVSASVKTIVEKYLFCLLLYIIKLYIICIAANHPEQCNNLTTSIKHVLNQIIHLIKCVLFICSTYLVSFRK